MPQSIYPVLQNAEHLHMASGSFVTSRPSMPILSTASDEMRHGVRFGLWGLGFLI